MSGLLSLTAATTLPPGMWSLVCVVVEDAGEGGDVRGVQPDHPDAKVFGLRGDRQQSGQKDCRESKTVHAGI